MIDCQVFHLMVEAARSAIKNREQLKLGEVLAQREMGVADLSGLAMVLGCSLRRLQYAIAIHHLAKRVGLSESDVRVMGPTKLYIIASRDDLVQSKADAGRLCNSHSVAELRAWLGGGSGAEQQVTFILSRKQRRQLENALLCYGAKRVGRVLIDKEAALMAIVRQSK